MKKYFFAVISVFFLNIAFADIVTGIEIGSKGIKAIAIDYRGLDNNGQQDYKIIFREDIRADIIDGAKDGYLQEKKIDEASQAVEVLFKKLKKYDPQHFDIVGSTSFDNYKNKAAFENAVEAKVGKRIAFITSDEEIFYALKASVRPKYLNRSILIDIGSGNTKIGYSSPMSSNGFESTRFEYGTKSLTQKANDIGGNYQDALRKVIKTEISPAIKIAIQKQPGIANVARRIYIEGGAPWAVASYAQPENISKSFTYLTAKEITSVVKKFNNGNLSYTANKDEVEDTFIKIMDNFDAKQLQAGGAILEAVLSEINADQRKIVFNRNGGWIIGYIFAKYNEKKGGDD